MERNGRREIHGERGSPRLRHCVTLAVLAPKAGVKTLSAYTTSWDRAFFRPSGIASLDVIADSVSDALGRARGENRSDVFVDLSKLTGFESPGPDFRRQVVRRWARAADGAVRAALVMRREHICPARIGLMAAAEEGFLVHACST